MSEQSVVKNAGDEGQVEKGKKQERFTRKDELTDLYNILSTKSGRRFIWKLITQFGGLKSIWSNSAIIHYNAGQQDAAHFLMSECLFADRKLYLLMQEENLS